MDRIPEFDDAAAIVSSDPLWDMERRWRKLSHRYDDIPGSCFKQCADELRAALIADTATQAGIESAAHGLAFVHGWLGRDLETADADSKDALVASLRQLHIRIGQLLGASLREHDERQVG